MLSGVRNDHLESATYWASQGTFRHGDFDGFCSVAKHRLIQEALISGQSELRSELGEEPG